MVSCKRLECGIHAFSLLNDWTAAGGPGLRAISEGGLSHQRFQDTHGRLELLHAKQIPAPFLCSRNVSLQYPAARPQNGADQNKSHRQHCTLPRPEYNKLAEPEEQEQYQDCGNAQPNQDEQSSDHFHPPIRFRLHLCPFNLPRHHRGLAGTNTERARPRGAPRDCFC